MRSEKGFTLVELAIVLMIIGLLIGGVLKGRELIETAKITSVLQQVHEYETALANFRSTYDSYPGDMANPQSRIPDCTVGCTNPGNGNGILDGGLGVVPGEYMWATGTMCENRNAWLHMAAAKMLNGVDSRGGTGGTQIAWGTDAPASKMGGGFHIFRYDPVTAGPIRGETITAPTGVYVILTKYLDNNWLLASMEYTYNGIVSAKQADQMDRKLDDGRPSFGRVVGLSSSGKTNCSGDHYTITDEEKSCTVLFSIE